jgi:hypothetical protein
MASGGESEQVPDEQAPEIAFDTPAAPQAAPLEGTEPSEAQSDPEEGEMLTDALEAVRQRVHLPSEVPSAIKRRPSPGRPKKGHKGPVGTGATRAKYASMKKSPAVKRALGIKDDDNGAA